jgi:hypothetical protein
MGMFAAHPKGDEPMSTTTPRRISTAETAALLRKALKAAHPAVKFRVRSKTYSGGSSIHVSWTDGPITPHVEATASLYQGARFDGMADVRHYHDSLLSTDDGAEVVRYSADFVMCQRDISPGYLADLENELAAFTGEPYDPCRSYHAAALAAPGSDEPARLCRTQDKTWGSELVHRLAWSRPRPAAPRQPATTTPTGEQQR